MSPVLSESRDIPLEALGWPNAASGVWLVLHGGELRTPLFRRSESSHPRLPRPEFIHVVAVDGVPMRLKDGRTLEPIPREPSSVLVEEPNTFDLTGWDLRRFLDGRAPTWVSQISESGLWLSRSSRDPGQRLPRYDCLVVLQIEHLGFCIVHEGTSQLQALPAHPPETVYRRVLSLPQLFALGKEVPR